MIAAIALTTAGAHAAVIHSVQIQLGGVDLQYASNAFVDHSPDLSDPDPLTNATFLLNGSEVGVVTTGVTLNLVIPGVANIPVAGGTVTSAVGGSFYLDLGGGDHLSLLLDQASVSYLPITNQVKFVFGGSAASIVSQQLPYVTLYEPVSVSFSSQVVPGSLTHNGTYVTALKSAGTGEVQGVPEPASLSVLALAGLSLIRRGGRTG